MKVLYYIFSVVVACLCAVSCSVMGSEMVWDINPIVLHVYVSDSDGNNLLSEESSGSGHLDIDKIYAVFDGQDYQLSTDVDEGNEPQTKAYMPQFQGLQLRTDFYGDKYLSFGELDGQEELKNVDLIIYWGDGTSDTITIFNHFKWKLSGEPSITRLYYVNGKQTESDIATFRFVK